MPKFSPCFIGVQILTIFFLASSNVVKIESLTEASAMPLPKNCEVRQNFLQNVHPFLQNQRLTPNVRSLLRHLRIKRSRSRRLRKRRPKNRFVFSDSKRKPPPNKKEGYRHDYAYQQYLQPRYSYQKLDFLMPEFIPVVQKTVGVVPVQPVAISFQNPKPRFQEQVYSPILVPQQVNLAPRQYLEANGLNKEVQLEAKDNLNGNLGVIRTPAIKPRNVVFRDASASSVIPQGSSTDTPRFKDLKKRDKFVSAMSSWVSALEHMFPAIQQNGPISKSDDIRPAGQIQQDFPSVKQTSSANPQVQIVTSAPQSDRFATAVSSLVSVLEQMFPAIPQKGPVIKPDDTRPAVRIRQDSPNKQQTSSIAPPSSSCVVLATSTNSKVQISTGAPQFESLTQSDKFANAISSLVSLVEQVFPAALHNVPVDTRSVNNMGQNFQFVGEQKLSAECGTTPVSIINQLTCAPIGKTIQSVVNLPVGQSSPIVESTAPKTILNSQQINALPNQAVQNGVNLPIGQISPISIKTAPQTVEYSMTSQDFNTLPIQNPQRLVNRPAEQISPILYNTPPKTISNFPDVKALPKQQIQALPISVPSTEGHQMETPNNLHLTHLCNETNSSLITSEEASSNKSKIIEQILEDVEAIRLQNSETKSREDLPCNLTGSWSSLAGGMLLNLTLVDNDTHMTLISKTPPGKEGFLTKPGWKLKGFKPYPKAGLIILTGVNNEDKHVATFIGECRSCGGGETVVGNWLIGRVSRDCKDEKASQTVLSDVWSRETLTQLRKERLKNIKRKSSFKKAVKDKEEKKGKTTTGY